MKRITTTAALLLIGASAPAFAQRIQAPRTPQPSAPAAGAAAGPAVRTSDAARAALVDLQKAVQAGDMASIPAKVAAAQAAARTKEDRYLLGRLQLQAAVASKDNAMMASAIDAIASSGTQPAAEVSKLHQALATTLFEQKQYAQAAAQLQKAQALEPSNSSIALNLAEALFAQGQTAEAVGEFQRVIAARTAAGQKPEESLYKRAMSMAYQAKLPAAAELGRAWVSAYPSADSWRNALAIYRNQTQQDVEGTLNLMRLMRAAGALSNPTDYALYASAAAEQSNYHEAQAVLDAGIQAGVVKPADPQFKDLVAEVNGGRKSTAAQLDEAIEMAPNPVNLMRIGDRFLAMGEQARAIEIYRDVMKKPGADQNLANLHLGMALAKAGDKAGAIAAFKAVSGARAGIAQYWLLFLQQQG